MSKTKTHDEFIKDTELAYQIAFELIEKINANKGVMGITIKGKNFVEGKEITDENGNPIIDNSTGQIRRYPDAYYIEFSNSTFGIYQLKVDRELFERLVVGGIYELNYMLKVREFINKSKSGNEYVAKQLMLEPLEFVDLKNYKVGV